MNALRIAVSVLGLVALLATMLPPWVLAEGHWYYIPEALSLGLAALPTLSLEDVAHWLTRSWIPLLAIGSLWAWGLHFARQADAPTAPPATHGGAVEEDRQASQH